MAGIGSYKKGKAFALKSGNKPSFKRMGAVEAIKQVDTSKNMNTQKEIYKAKLRGDYQDLTGDKLEKASYDDPTGTVVSKGFSIPDSPAKTGDHSTPDPVDGHQHLTDEQKLTAAYRRKDESINKTMSKYNISEEKAKEIWNKQSGHRTKIIKKKSPAKTHDGTKSSTTHYKDGSPKSKREVAFSERHEGEVAKSPTTNYQKRKEQLLNQGFTQKDADQMIKSGAVTGETSDKAKAEHPKYEKRRNMKKKLHSKKWKPAYEGGDYSKKDLRKMSRKERKIIEKGQE